MRIYRGNIGIELSLHEFEQLLEDNDKVDDLLNLIHDMEMDELMNYDPEDIKRFEKELMKEAAEYQQAQGHKEDIDIMKRTLDFLDKYGK